MGLPSELRNMIYEYCLVSSTGKVQVSCSTGSPFLHVLLSGRALLRVSRQVRVEAQAIVYSRNTMIHGLHRRREVRNTLGALQPFARHCVYLRIKYPWIKHDTSRAVDLQEVFHALTSSLQSLKGRAANLRLHFCIAIATRQRVEIFPSSLDPAALDLCKYGTVSGPMSIVFIKTQLHQLLQTVRKDFPEHQISTNLRLDTTDIRAAQAFCDLPRLPQSLAERLRCHNAKSSTEADESCSVAISPQARSRNEAFKTCYLDENNIWFMDFQQGRRGTMSLRWPWPGELAVPLKMTRVNGQSSSSPMVVPMIRFYEGIDPKETFRKSDRFPSKFESPQDAMVYEIASKLKRSK